MTEPPSPPTQDNDAIKEIALQWTRVSKWIKLAFEWVYSPTSTKNQSQVSWYETSLFWGSASATAAIVLTVVAAFWHDLRWLLIPAWPLATVSVWAITRQFSRKRLGRVITAVASILIAFCLYRLNVSLKPTPVVVQPSSLPPTKEEIAAEVIKRLPEALKPTTQKPPLEPTRSLPSADLEGPCRIGLEVDSRIVARLYARKDINLIRMPGQATLTFDFEQLFYVWKLTVSASRRSTDTLVEIQPVDKSDILHVIPEDSQVSDLKARWVSGFDEPARHTPDWYARTVRFGLLARGQPGVVSIRRELNEPTLQPHSIIRLSDVRSPSCVAKLPEYLPEPEAKRLSRQADQLTKWHYDPNRTGPTQLPLRHDPGDVGQNEVEASVEAYCQDIACNKRIIGKLSVHMGQTPNELYRSRHPNLPN